MNAPAAAAFLASVLLASAASAADCPPATASREQLLELKAHEFAVPDAGRRQALALDLLACLGSSDAELRDNVAFQALAHWMRAKQLSAETVGVILERLLPQLAPTYPDPQGVLRPFAVLVLAEVARFDRVEQFMSDRQREQLVVAGSLFVQSVRDYRGFDEREGWRHGVAHGSDLLLQLAVNPRTTKADLERMLAAIAAQIAPAGEHHYLYGEGDRLAQAVFYIAQRKLHSQDEWRKWFELATAPAPLASWRGAYDSQRGLAKRHNTMEFLSSLYLYVRENGADFQDRVSQPLLAAIKPLM